MRGSWAVAFLVLFGFANAQLKHPNPAADSLEAKLWEAVKSGRAGDTELLLAQGAKVNTWYDDEPNPLFGLGGQAPTLQRIGRALVAAGANVHARDTHGRNLLASRCADASLGGDLIAYFASLGVDPNEPDDSGETPLHHALVNPDHIEPLVNAGAILTKKNKRGETPAQAYVKQVSRFFADYSPIPIPEDRARIIEEKEFYRRLLDPEGKPFEVPKPKLDEHGYVFNPVSILGAQVERQVRYGKGKAIVTLTITNDHFDQPNSFTILEASLRFSPTNSKLPIKVDLEAREKKKVVLEFPAPKVFDASLDIYYTSTIAPDEGLRVASDHGLALPSFEVSSSTIPEAPTGEVRVMYFRGYMAIRLLEVKIEGKVQPTFAGSELVFDQKTVLQVIPGLLVPKTGKKTAVTFEFRSETNGRWRRSTVML